MSKKLIIYIIIIVIVVFIIYILFFSNLNIFHSRKNNNVIVKSDGLKIEILKNGSGEKAKIGDVVTVDYIGKLTNGIKFDSSYNHGKPFSFKLGSGLVIKGWEEGVLGMKVGEERKLTIPPDLGYGSAGTPGGPIPPNATLIFYIKLLKVN